MPVQPATFTLTQDHLTLLQHAFVGWQDCETGAPEIDPKRPYGNSDVPSDVAELLGKPALVDDEGDIIDEDRVEEMDRLHRETQIALQVILCHAGRATPLGQYVLVGKYPNRWRHVDDKGQTSIN